MIDKIGHTMGKHDPRTIEEERRATSSKMRGVAAQLSAQLDPEALKNLKVEYLPIGDPIKVREDGTIVINYEKGEKTLTEGLIKNIGEALEKRARALNLQATWERVGKVFEEWRGRYLGSNTIRHLLLGDLGNPESFLQNQNKLDAVLQYVEEVKSRLGDKLYLLRGDFEFVDEGGSRGGKGSSIIIDVTEDLEAIKQFLRDKATLDKYKDLL